MNRPELTQRRSLNIQKTAQPVIHIQHIQCAKDHFLLPETEGVKIHDCVKPLGNETVINKNYPNSFRETNLDAELKKIGVVNWLSSE